ncbi:molybdenum-dependent transcriptional regulator [Canicola haemoglobinophilus]|uniref:Molybdenum transport protein n=1 Tax=Canicola haemoglobinophilus TaxID=733 RepID=A0A1V4B3H5_9PAST|nr:TOBE domain-containing protein [Canicola haemoglobinophilus]OOS01934.1 molybdenum-dependent transcriptional regulator [Canicola haemoglobinophilus]STO60384.1 molybdenum transport protein [Canicola haemoglobinophilus]
MNSEILLSINLQQQLFVDPKRVRLLQAIQQFGSINQAAKNCKISYKSAWDHLENMNSISPKPLLDRNTGGKNGGGTMLTSYALRLLQLYDLLAKTQQKAFDILQDEEIELTSLLSATAKFSLQSSARNQLFGKIINLHQQNSHCLVEIAVDNLALPLYVSITQKSAVRLQLVLGKEVILMIKAPWLKLHEQQSNEINCFPSKVQAISEDQEEISIKLGNTIECYASVTQGHNYQLNQEIWCSIEPEQIILVTL